MVKDTEGMLFDTMAWTKARAFQAHSPKAAAYSGGNLLAGVPKSVLATDQDKNPLPFDVGTGWPGSLTK